MKKLLVTTAILATAMITGAQASEWKLQSLALNVAHLADCVNDHGGEDGCLRHYHLSNHIFKAYQFYVAVDFCHQVREGYLITYINDVEMRRAKQAIKSIVDKALSEDPPLAGDTDDLWNYAQKATDDWAITRSMCQDTYLFALLGMSPVNPVQVHKPN